MRRYIQDRYAADVFDIYGCTEIKEIAWECERHNGYHINEDEVLVEILNGDKPVGWVKWAISLLPICAIKQCRSFVIALGIAGYSGRDHAVAGELLP